MPWNGAFRLHLCLLRSLPWPVSVSCLYTGPPLYKVGWNEKIRRSNTLWVTGHLDATHTVHHSRQLQLTRVSLVDSTPEEAVHVKLYYGIVNRVDVYVDGKLKNSVEGHHLGQSGSS